MPGTPSFATYFGAAATIATSLTDTARLYAPGQLAADAAGNVYVFERGSLDGMTNNVRIVKITPEGYGTVQVTDALVAQADSFAVIGEEDLFVGNGNDFRWLARITAGASTAIIGSGLAGYLDGPSSTAKIGDGGFYAMAVIEGNLWWGDFVHPRIRKVDGAGNVSTIAGDGTTSWANGTGTAAKVGFTYPSAVGDASGNYWFTGGNVTDGLFVAKCTPAGVVTDEVVYTGIATSLIALSHGPDGNLYLLYAGSGDFRIDKIVISTSTATMLYSFTSITPRGMTIDPAGNIFVSAVGGTYGYTIQKIANAVTPVGASGKPVITLHPHSGPGTVGTALTLKSAATGNPTPTVRWQVVSGDGPSTGLPTLNGEAGIWPEGTEGLVLPGQDNYPDPLGPWVNISGATSPDYTHTPSTAGVFRFKAVYTNSSGQTTTNAATVTVSTATDLDVFHPGKLVPSSDVHSPGEGTPGAVTRTANQPGSATILALVREFSSSTKIDKNGVNVGGVGRAIRITGPREITMVDPAAPNDLLTIDPDALYSAASTSRATTTKALAVLSGAVQVTATASLKTNDVSILVSGWQIPDRLPVRGIGLKPVKSVQMTFTPHTFACGVTFHVG
jgi:hypothetical protein